MASGEREGIAQQGKEGRPHVGVVEEGEEEEDREEGEVSGREQEVWGRLVQPLEQPVKDSEIGHCEHCVLESEGREGHSL